MHVLNGGARSGAPYPREEPAHRGPDHCELAPGGRDAAAARDDGDFERLRAHGFTDRDIWDIGAIAGFFNFSNRMANLAALRPNPEFYTMGRAAPPD